MDASLNQPCTLTGNEVTESKFNLLTSTDGSKGMKATYWNNSEMKGAPPRATQAIFPGIIPSQEQRNAAAT